jgi:predicted RNA methylase
MGTGTGVLALLAARLGASEVTASDNNPNALVIPSLQNKNYALRFTFHALLSQRSPQTLRCNLILFIHLTQPYGICARVLHISTTRTNKS